MSSKSRSYRNSGQQAATTTQQDSQNFSFLFSPKHRMNFPLSKIQASKAHDSRTAVRFPSEIRKVFVRLCL